MANMLLLYLALLGLLPCSSLAAQRSIKGALIKDVLGASTSYYVVNYACTRAESIATSTELSSSFYVANYNPPFDELPLTRASNVAFYIVDLSCNDTLHLVEEANRFKLFSTARHWLFFGNAQSRDLLQNADVLPDSDAIFAEATTEDDSYELWKFYKNREGLQVNYEPYGKWQADEGFLEDAGFVRTTAVRRRNLSGTVIRACLVITHNDSLRHLLDKREKHIDTIAKVNYVFMLHIGDLLNATMKYTIESTWGYLDNESNWNGMIGELTKRKADIGGTPLFLTSDRVPIIDYVAMTTPTKSKFVFRQPKLSYITNVFTLPFNNNVWISSILLVVVTGAGLFWVVKWEWYKRKTYGVVDKSHDGDAELRDSLNDVAFLSIGAVCQQGSSVVPSDSAGRIITILLYIALMFLYTSYSANIVALLQSSSTSIQTLEDLLRSRLQVGVDDTVFNHFYFPNASEPVRRALYLQKVAPPGQKPRYFPIEEGVKRLREGLFAFHMETGAGYKLVGETFLEDEKCGLEEIQFLQVPDPWLAIQKNSSYKEIIKIGLRKLHESGIQPREVSLLYTKKPVCISRGSSFVGVGMVDCYTAVAIFAGGAFGSLLVLLLENAYHKFRMRQHKF